MPLDELFHAVHRVSIVPAGQVGLLGDQPRFGHGGIPEKLTHLQHCRDKARGCERPPDLGSLGEVCAQTDVEPGCLPRQSPSLTDMHKRPGERPGPWAASIRVVGSPRLSRLQPQGTEPLLCSTCCKSCTWDALGPYPDPWRGHSSTGMPVQQEAGAGAEGGQEAGAAYQRWASSSVSAGSSPWAP